MLQSHLHSFSPCLCIYTPIEYVSCIVKNKCCNTRLSITYIHYENHNKTLHKKNIRIMEFSYTWSDKKTNAVDNDSDEFKVRLNNMLFFSTTNSWLLVAGIFVR